MAEFKGEDLILNFAGTDLSGGGRVVTVSEAPGEAEKLDVTVKGDSARQYLEGFPGGANTTVTLTALAQASTDPIEGIAANTTGAIEILPEGDTAGAISVDIAAMRLIGKDYTVPYNGAVEWSLTFNSATVATYGTTAGP